MTTGGAVYPVVIVHFYTNHTYFPADGSRCHNEKIVFSFCSPNLPKWPFVFLRQDTSSSCILSTCLVTYSQFLLRVSFLSDLLMSDYSGVQSSLCYTYITIFKNCTKQNYMTEVTIFISPDQTSFLNFRHLCATAYCISNCMCSNI